MGKHAIIVIKNENNEYLQYFDKRWNSFLFLNCKLDEKFNNQDIINYVSNKLEIEENLIKCTYIGEKTHTKFSESAQKEKEYQHFFYSIEFKDIPSNMNKKDFVINNEEYTWYSYNELKEDERIQKVNSDIVEFVKEFNI